MLTENDVVDAVRRYLQDKGWKIDSFCHVEERGIDIVAKKARRTMHVEAKGQGPVRGNAREFSNNQKWQHVSDALHRAIRSLAGKECTCACMAFPDDERHRQLVQDIKGVLTTLHIGVFLVRRSRPVEFKRNGIRR